MKVKINDIRHDAAVLDYESDVEADVAIPVWLWGWYNANVEREYKKKYGFVLSDMAHCIEESDADAAVLSFHAVKMLTGGEGGMILTNRRDVYEYVRGYVNLGRTRGRRCEMNGSNYKMSEITAAFVLSGVDFLDEQIGHGAWLYEEYREFVDEHLKRWVMYSPRSEQHLFWGFSGYLCPLVVDVPREIVEARLLHDYGIETFAGYSRYVPTDEPFFNGEVISEELGKWLSRHVVFLPCYYGMDRETLNKVCNALKELEEKLK